VGQTFRVSSAGPDAGASSAGVVAVCHGVEVLGSPHLTPARVQSLQDGSFAEGFLAGALAAIRPADRVLHIGAADGVVAAVIARNCRPAQVLAFVGDPALVLQARALCRHNDLDDRLAFRHGRVTAAPDAPELPEPDCADPATIVPVARYDRLRRTCLHNVPILDIDDAERDFLIHANLVGVRLVLQHLHPGVCGRDRVRHSRRALGRAGYERDLALSGAEVDVFRRVRA
jgi:hypothetical protein